MIYLLVASVLISAHSQYYSIDRVPEFWDWLQYMAQQGHLKMPIEIFEEVKDGPKDKDLLFDWLQAEANKNAIILAGEADPGLVQQVITTGYAADLNDNEIEQLGRDPFLIAHAIAGSGRCVVTVEVSQPSKKRQNRKIPDVCKALGVKCCDPFTFARELAFSTDWKKKLGL